MIREDKAFNHTYRLVTDKGKYILQRLFGEKLTNELVVPKADIDYLKKCTSNEVHFYFTDRMFQEFEKNKENKDAY